MPTSFSPLVSSVKILYSGSYKNYYFHYPDFHFLNHITVEVYVLLASSVSEEEQGDPAECPGAKELNLTTVFSQTKVLIIASLTGIAPLPRTTDITK